MRSTFMGLETSKKGLFVQQSALYTTGHNISNANTDGYSRQRVNMSATPGYPYPGLNSPTYPGHLGTGVEVTSIQRIRDEFIDRQYRQETGKLGYWESTLNSINQAEDILSEPSKFGINQSFSDFWKAFQDVATNPEDTAARKVAIAKAEALSDSFNYNYTQLETIQGNLGNEINVTTKDVNSLLKKIAVVNEQIMVMEPNGYVTNDLYDTRDLLIDELNEYLPVSFERVPSGGNANPIAEGSLTVFYKTAQGESVILVHGKEHAEIAMNDIAGNEIDSAMGNDGKYELFGGMNIKWSDNTPPNVAIFPNINIVNPLVPSTRGENYDYTRFEKAKGKLMALVDAYGYNDGGVTKGIYPELLGELNTLAKSFVDVFNRVHGAGYSLNSTNATANGDGGNFFDPNSTGAKDIKVAARILNDPKAIAASSGKGEEGNGKWATELANLQFKGIGATAINITVGGTTIDVTGNLDGATFQGFYSGIVGDLAVKGQEAIRLEYNSETLRLQIENNRASMSSVSLDEEMSNMITFQQAYNANARMITVVDEILDNIINGMGRVGL